MFDELNQGLQHGAYALVAVDGLGRLPVRAVVPATRHRHGSGPLPQRGFRPGYPETTRWRSSISCRASSSMFRVSSGEISPNVRRWNAGTIDRLGHFAM